MNENNMYRKLYDIHAHNRGISGLTIPHWDTPSVIAALKFAADAYDMREGWFKISEVQQPSIEVLTVEKEPF